MSRTSARDEYAVCAGRGAGGKTVVFGLLKRGDSVYTEIVPDATKRTLQAIIRGRADIASIIHTDRWRGYDGLVDVGFDKHLRAIMATMSLLAARCMSTASRASGAMPSAGWSSSMGCRATRSICTSKTLSTGSITAMTASTARCYSC